MLQEQSSKLWIAVGSFQTVENLKHCGTSDQSHNHTSQCSYIYNSFDGGNITIKIV